MGDEQVPDPAVHLRPENALRRRPWWCQDPSCTPLHPIVRGVDDPGMGGFCCGVMAEPTRDVLHGVEHNNDQHLCIRSPRSGVTMLNVQLADWIALGDMVTTALARENPKMLRRLIRRGGEFIRPATPEEEL